MTLPHERPATGRAAAFAARLASELPVLTTERLTLRAPRIEDFAAYREIAEGPAGRFLMVAPGRKSAWLDFAQMTATWLLRGHGLWSVERREDRALAGFVFIGFEHGDHEPELGYMFRAEFEGFGYAREASEAAKAHALGTLGLASLVSTVDHDNARSRRLAERLGGARDAAAEAAHGNDIIVYRYNVGEGAR